MEIISNGTVERKIDLKVKINEWESIYNREEYHEVSKLWISPDERYMIVEWYKSELYVFVSVDKVIDDTYVGNFIEVYEPHYMDIDLRVYSADWSCMKYGFCKLMLFEMESGFDGCVKRFYFDKELYIRSYEEETGRKFKKKRWEAD